MDLTEILEQIEEHTVIAEYDVNLAPPATRQGIAARKAASQQKLAMLKASYLEEAWANRVVVYPIGDPELVGAFCTAASEERSAVTVSTSRLYAKIADEVEWVTEKSRRVGPTQIGALVDALRRELRDLGGGYVPELPFKGTVICNTRQDTEDYVRKLIRSSSLGDTVGLAYIRKVLAEES